MAVPIRRLALDRRTFLRSGAATIALPMLSAMVPAMSPRLRMGSRPGDGPTRCLFIFLPNGQNMAAWKPVGEGKDFEFSPTLEPLRPVRDRISILSGLGLEAGTAKGDGAGDHARAAGTFLTAMRAKKTGGADIRVGVSVDQVMAQKLGGATRLGSLELGAETGRAAGNCDSGYSCAYTNNISWRTPSLPCGKEVRPLAIFNRIHGITADAADADASGRAHARKSILDLARGDAAGLLGELGPTDRRKVEEYLDAVREIEIRLAKATSAVTKPEGSAAEFPEGVPKDYAEHLRLLYDLLVLAFRADATRIATMMTGNAGANRSYRWLDCPDGHHDTSHHRDDPKKLEALARINRWHVDNFARFLKALEAADDGDATLLDRSMIVYGSGISDGNQHSHHDLPIVLAGGGNGTLHPGRHLVFSEGTPLANLHLSLLDRMNVRQSSFADSQGRIDDL